MASLFVYPEQAEEYIARQHMYDLRLPRNYNFSDVSNHLEASVVYIAMTGVGADLRYLYANFYAVRQKNTYVPDTSPREARRTRGYDRFDEAMSFAIAKRSLKRFNQDPIEAIQDELANEWRLDSRIVTYFAVDLDGVTAEVYKAGGYGRLDDAAVPPSPQELLENAIDSEFRS